MSSAQSLAERRRAVVPQGAGQFNPASTAVSGRGAILVDADGRELIDFAGGIGVMNVGHCHPEVVRAIAEQAGRLTHTCIHVATYEPYIELCEALAARFPHGDRTKVLLNNTGAEAVENAVKIARQATGRSAVLCYSEGFHGRTLMAMTLTSKVGYKVGCGPYAPEVYRLAFPNRFKFGDGLGEAAFVERELGRFKQALVSMVPAEQVAAVIIEPVQGEGGFVPAPVGYLRGLRRLCDEHGIMLICDEVQTGFGRTGKWAAYEHAGIIPDISTWAKSMGGGMPIAGVIGKAEVMDAARPGTLGGTYGGNPVACAAALAAMRVIENENLNARAVEVGARIRRAFESIQNKHPGVVADVRGLGAMIAMELVEDGDKARPATRLTAQLIANCHRKGLLIVTAGSFGNIVRTLCPLVITDAQLDRGLAILDEELTRLASSPLASSEAMVPSVSGATR